MQISRDTTTKCGKIGTQICMGFYTQCNDLSIIIKTHFCFCYMITAMCIQQKTFCSFRGPFYGTTDLPGTPCKQCFFSIVKHFTSKGAANIRAYHSYFMFRNTKNKCAHQQPDHMRGLCTCVQCI